jgi:Ribose/Galactose Isomerase
MRVAIGSDHAGFELKEAVKTFLAAEHHEVVDVGTHHQDPVDYPDYAQAVRRGRPGVESRARHPPLRQRRWRLDGREQDAGHPRRPVP